MCQDDDLLVLSFISSKERWFIEWENGGGVCVRLER